MEKKTYAEVVTGSPSSGSTILRSWSHIQTQDEEEALILGVRNSLSFQVVYVEFYEIDFESFRLLMHLVYEVVSK